MMKTAALKVILALFVSTLGSGCTTTKGEAEPGIQDGYVGYIPARIAILPCLSWPEGTRWQSKPLSTADKNTITDMCAKFDVFTLAGFANQPFMKGYSPTFVERALNSSGKTGQLAQIASLWNQLPSDCMDCTNVASFYRRSIASRQAWQLWLSESSSLVRNADAFLIPTVLYGWERRFNDRGVVIVERSAAAALLLINASNGDLIWAGQRTAVVPVRRLEQDLNHAPLAAPDWSLVSDRIFTDHLWSAFPGRQVY